ncbi:MAG: uroporphyrinogen decarboxylase family protein [Verrucomicrobia bacterium]|nr:uroporphyrinogen decarboxylase family protein [Verrucomicrobiota bacterium]
MTGRELTMAAIKGIPHARVPVAQHNFTFCARLAGVTMEQYRRDPKLAARVLADASYQFGYDCIIIDFDTCSLAEAMGASLSFPVDAPAHVSMPPLQSLSQIRDLPIPDPHRDGRLPLWLETTRELRKIVGNDKAIMARADQGPFGLLFQLRGHENLMMDVMDCSVEEMEAALEICAQVGSGFARAQMEAGADLTSIGDSASGESLISPAHYHLYGGPFQKRYKELLGDDCLSLHICGKTNNIIEGMVQSGCEVLELDHWNDLERSLAVIDHRSCVFGNLDPSSVLSQGTKQRVLDASREVLEHAKAKTWKFVLCPGCLANADVPPDNIHAMTEAASCWGQYDKPPIG